MKNNDKDDSIQSLSDNDSSNNEYVSDDDQKIHDNLNPPPDQEME